MTKVVEVTSEPFNLPIQLKYILRYAERIMVDGSSFSFQLPLELFGIPRKSYVLREDVIDLCNMQKVKTLSMRDARKSTSGLVFTLNGGTVVWRSIKQSCITDSTMEAEYVAACEAAKEAVGYKHYCETRFFKLIGKPSIFDEENEEYAYMRCKEIWVKKYPTQSFELEENSSLRDRFSDECSSFVPASDILLMWLTHQSYPTVYAKDVKKMQGDLAKVVRFGETVNSKELDETKQLVLMIFQSQKNLKNTRKTTFWKAVGTVECGYYVMRYMREIVSKDTSIIIDVIDTRNSYSQLELDEVRVEWAEFLSRYI
ncbi:glycine-rich domain-containing protein 1-like [Cucumis melo var. makuwa]|uniref:Glycine-rich domain-containing protein 1-like n=1 Tax=Cucumis melo var. makuwa TaxID=1194695 RepID=A0A5A7SUF2_CUCMM|nr:glycine-rich domain-containing protein 1-like [Cucumis melo var. makuwa]